MSEFKPKNLFFNQLIDHGDHFEKVSTNSNKLREEFHFLSTVPEELRFYYPKVFDYKVLPSASSYKIEKIPTHDASFFLVSKGSYHLEKIQMILDGISEYLDKIPSLQSSFPEYQKSILRNIYIRNLSMLQEITKLPQYKNLNDICVFYGYNDIHHYCDVINEKLREAFLKVKSKRLYYSHGDLRFANILPTDEKIFFIDPKGYIGDIKNTYRTMYYDLAQISSSILGGFDLINHELFEIQENEVKFSVEWIGHERIVNKFDQMLKDFGADISLVRKLEASSFLSLIPFHKKSEKKVLGLLISSINIFQKS